MASSAPRRLSRWTATPMLAVAVFGLAACSPPGQESSNVKGTDPATFTSSPAPGGERSEAEPSGSTPHVTLRDPSGNEVGTATFADDGGFVKVTVSVHGLKPGFHGLHLHQVGKCEPNSAPPAGGEPGAFLSAGGHFQVGDRNTHPSSGDLTSLQVRKDGGAELTTTTDAVTLSELTADGGHAIIVHADADNFGNIPSRYSLSSGGASPDTQTLSTGDAGGRVACGVVK